MESSAEAKLTLCNVPGAAKTFPEDPNGNYTITFGTKTYKCQPYVVALSPVLSELIKTNAKIDLTSVLTPGKSEEAIDSAMKLLFGLKNVLVKKNQFVQLYYLLEELKINNEEGDFRQEFFKSYLSEPSKENVLELLEMAFNLNTFELKQKCLEFLANEKFKDLSLTNDKINTLTETTFAYLMQQAISKESSNPNKLQEYEQILCNYFENKLSHYQQQLFKKLNSTNQLRAVIPTQQGPIINQFIEEVQIPGNQAWLQKFLLQTKAMQRNMKTESIRLLNQNNVGRKDEKIAELKNLEARLLAERDLLLNQIRGLNEKVTMKDQEITVFKNDQTRIQNECSQLISKNATLQNSLVIKDPEITQLKNAQMQIEKEKKGVDKVELATSIHSRRCCQWQLKFTHLCTYHPAERMDSKASFSKSPPNLST